MWLETESVDCVQPAAAFPNAACCEGGNPRFYRASFEPMPSGSQPSVAKAMADKQPALPRATAGCSSPGCGAHISKTSIDGFFWPSP